MITNTEIKILNDIIKNMKCNSYIITNGRVIGCKTMKNKKQFDIIESISYVDVGIYVDRMYSFADIQYNEFVKSKIELDIYDDLFNKVFDDPLVIGNYQLLMAFDNVMNLLNNIEPNFIIDNLKDDENFLQSYLAKSKCGLKFIKFDNYLIPSYKSICHSTKKEKITLNVYDNIYYKKYGLNNIQEQLQPTTILDYIVDKKKYKVHNLYRIISM